MKLLVVCGPTATGKTTLAARLAKTFNGELISADSRQVYRGMDLVTGKDKPDVPIWLYDVVDPDKEFSVGQWVRLAKDAITDITRRNKLPIVAGGTGLYIKALLEPFDTIDIPPNEHLRKKLTLLPVRELQEMIERGEMNDSDWNNSRRLIRKIEIAKSIRPRLTTQGEALKKQDVLVIGLMAPISVLDDRIEERIKIRKQNGLEKEVASLLARYDKNLPSMSAIGLNEYAYARRQIIWFKKQKNILWFDIMDTELIAKVTTTVSKWYEN